MCRVYGTRAFESYILDEESLSALRDTGGPSPVIPYIEAYILNPQTRSQSDLPASLKLEPII